MPGSANSRETAAARDLCPPIEYEAYNLGPLGAAELCVLRAGHRDEPYEEALAHCSQHHHPETGVVTLKGSVVDGSA